VAGLFDTGGASLVVGPWSNVVDMTVERPLADLRVTAMAASDQSVRAGRAAVISTTVTNAGDGEAAASVTRLTLADGTLVGSAETPAIGPGQATTVTVTWNTRGLDGEHVITALADADGTVVEVDEENNEGTLRVTVRGNRVRNGSFEEPAPDGAGPSGWSASSSSAGTTGYEEDGTDGERSVSITGTGASVALGGVPAWTSDPIDVIPGETLSLVASVRATGMSSAPSVGLALLGPAGDLLRTLTVATVPRTTVGVVQVDEVVTVPAGVAQVRIVLAGFGPTDVRTSGTVVFDDIGLYAD
jgi:hypothetical protein